MLDNVVTHRAGTMSAFVISVARLSLMFLPPYLPEFNSIGQLWAYGKRTVLVN